MALYVVAVASGSLRQLRRDVRHMTLQCKRMSFSSLLTGSVRETKGQEVVSTHFENF